MNSNFLYKGAMAGLLVTCASNALAAPLTVTGGATESATAAYDNIAFTDDSALTIDTAAAITSNGAITVANDNEGTINITAGGDLIMAAGQDIGVSGTEIKLISTDDSASTVLDKADGDAFIKTLDLGANSTLTSTAGTLTVGNDAAGSDMTVQGAVNLGNTAVILDAGENMLIDGNATTVTLTGTSSVNTGITVGAGVTGATISGANTSNTGAIVLTDTAATLTLADTATVGAVTLGNGSTLNVNAVTAATIGAVDGAAASQGTLEFNTADHAIKNAIGSTNALSKVEVTDVTVTAGADISADTVNLNGSSSVIDLASATVTGNLTTTTTNEGTVNFTNTAGSVAGNIGTSTHKLAAVNVSAGTTVTAGGDIFATTLHLGGAGTGIVNASNSDITANLTTQVGGQGVLNLNGTGSFVGNIGTSGTALSAVNYTGTSTMGSTAGAEVHATNINVSGGTTTAGADTTLSGTLALSGASTTLDLASHDAALTGAFTTGAGSTIGTTITSASDYGNVHASTTGTVDTATKVAINVADNSALKGGESFTIVNADAGTNVADLTASNITDNSNLFSFTQTGSGGVEDLVVTSALDVDFAADTAGKATAGVGSALQTDLAAGTLSTGLATSLNTLAGLSAAEQAAALSKMTPELNGATIETAFDNQNRIYNSISNRLRSVEGEGLWLDTSVTSTEKDTVKGIDGYDADAKSITIGADVMATADTKAGVAFTYTQTDIEGNDSVKGNDTDVDSYNVTFYGAKELNGVTFDGQATVGKGEYESKRDLTAIGGGIAKGDYDAKTYGVAANVSKEYMVSGFNVRPVAGLAYNKISLDDYQETGSTANLNVDSESFDSLKSKVGVEVELAKVQLNQNWTMSPEVRGFWSHEFMDDTYDRTAKLSSGSSFTSKGAEPESDVLSIGAGVNLAGTNSWNVGLAYDADISSDTTAHAAKLQVSKKF